MSASKKKLDFDQPMLLRLMSMSKDEFQENYSEYDDWVAAKLYSIITKEILKAFHNSKVVKFQKLLTLIKYVKSIEIESKVKNFNCHIDESIKYSNFVILACKHDKVQVLEYLFNNTDVVGLFKNDQTLVKPDDTDGEGHNAFYYAIRSGNCKLVEALITKWPQEYSKLSPQDICNLLAYSYEELKLKNISLSDDMIIHVESLLIDHRFYSDSINNKYTNIKITHEDIKERINLVIDNIALLTRDYSSTEVDGRFFYILSFITQNINILKRSLRSTYNELPWEEIEFCLIAFICNERKYETQRNVISNFFLTKDKLFHYLDTFRLALENEKNNIDVLKIKELAILPNIRREKNVSHIINNNPDWKDLYNDYQNLRDTHSLEVISRYLDLALKANSKDREGKIIIIRTLQVMGEYLKNTLESPKMSSIIGDMLMTSLPTNTQRLIINMRNSLSHGFSQSQNLKMDSTDLNLFSNIQEDMKVLSTAINNILHKTRLQHFAKIFKEIIMCETAAEIDGVLKTLHESDLKDWSNIYGEDKGREIITLIEELYSISSNGPFKEFVSLTEIKKLITTEYTSKFNEFDFMAKLTKLFEFRHQMKRKYIDSNRIRDIKNHALSFLSTIPSKIDGKISKKIEHFVSCIINGVQSTASFKDLERASVLANKIMYNIGSDLHGLKWIEEIGDQLNENNENCTEKNESRKKRQDKGSKLNEEYNVKISTLKDVLNNNQLDNISSYKNNNKLQATIEMLVLDLFSILNDSGVNIVCDDNFFLDKYSPILIGKNLRNHLAHGNDIVEILQFDPSIAVFLNAKKFTTENVIESDVKASKVLLGNLNDLKIKYNYELKVIAIQEEMFSALELGDLEKVMETLKRGADLRGKNYRSWTALHFAAKGPSVAVVKFVLDQKINSEVKNNCNQTALHIAAMYGRLSNVELLLNKKFNVNSLDNCNQSPLHAAAEHGHEEVVKILLKNKADTSIEDYTGHTPLHHAVLNDYKNIVAVLLERDRNVDANRSFDGSTALHLAVKSGRTSLVEYLINCKANVNQMNHQKDTPLSTAAYNGYLEIVKILISNHADIHNVNVRGFTTLHYAVDACQEEMVRLLLKHGANVNSCDRFTNYTPILSAAERGNVNILKLLIEHKAKINVSSSDGITPLHSAANYGHVDIVEVLINNKATLDAKDKNGMTPLHLAVIANQNHVVEFLIKKGASTSSQNLCKLSPLHSAAAYGKAKCIQILLQNGVTINSKDGNGQTALHYSSRNGHLETVEFLLSKGADVNFKDSRGFTPLYEASFAGNVKIVDELIRAGASIDLNNSIGCSALHCGIIEGHANVVECLIRNKASIASKISGSSLLQVALYLNYPDIAKILIENNISINDSNQDHCPALDLAITRNYVDIVKLLLNRGVQVRTDEGGPLFLAVIHGHKNIVSLLFSYGKIDINQKFSNDLTLLHHAAMNNHTKIAEFLLDKGANINALSFVGTPLHAAAAKGHINMIKFLLSRGIDSTLKECRGCRALEVATGYGHMEIVELLLDREKIDINKKCNDDFVLLHIAAQGGRLPVTEMLVEKGADIHARDEAGLKSIHFAAHQGHKHIIEYYLNKNMDMYDRGPGGWTLLHYAVDQKRKETVEYLIDKKFDVNTTDFSGQTALHLALDGPRDIVEILLNNNAVYNSTDMYNMKPSQKATNTIIVKLFDNIEKLFEGVKQNNIVEVKRCIEQKVIINAFNSDKVTSLHFAAWKGFTEIVKILLNNKANPNAVNDNGTTPIHYAAKFGHFQIVELLLINGAIYDPKTKKNNTPLDLAKESKTIELLKFIDRLFVNVTNHDMRVFYDLKNTKNLDTVKAAMNARNNNNNSLIIHATQSNYPKVELLEYIHQDQDNLVDLSDQAKKLMLSEQFDKASKVYNEVIDKKKQFLNPEDPSIFDTKFNNASIAYQQQNYQKALSLCNEVRNKQMELLGVNNKRTLKTNCLLAMITFRLGDINESLKLFKETYEKQKKILANDDEDLLLTQVQMSQILMNLGKFDEALSFYNDALQKYQKNCGMDNPNVLTIKNNIAKIYNMQGKYNEALKLYDEVYIARKRVLGPNNSYTLRTISNKCEVLATQKKFHEALPMYKKLLASQVNALGQNHLDTLTTKSAIGDIYLEQKNALEALKMYKNVVEPMTSIYGSTHGIVIRLKRKIELVESIFQTTGDGNLLNYCQNNVQISEIANCKDSIEALLQDGMDINEKDENGLTLLDHALNNQNEIIVEFLLKNKANCSLLSGKGNTALHFAVNKNNKNIVITLLEHAKKVLDRSKLQSFIDAKTTKGGMTCIHVAAQKGFEDIVGILLQFGATFNDKNFSDLKTPYQLCTNDNIKELFELIDKLFIEAKNGSDVLIEKLKRCDAEKRKSILNARDVNQKTLINVTLANNHKNLANQLLEMLKKTTQ